MNIGSFQSLPLASLRYTCTPSSSRVALFGPSKRRVLISQIRGYGLGAISSQVAGGAGGVKSAGGGGGGGRGVSRPLLGTLRVHGPDTKGVAAACFKLLNGHGCGIVKSEQWTDRDTNRFFQRICFDYGDFGCGNLDATDTAAIRRRLQDELQRQVLDRFRGHEGELNVRDERDEPFRIAVMVSKYDHCLWEILLRHRADELRSTGGGVPNCDISLVLSNHETCRPIVQDTFGIPYEVFRITPENKKEQERLQLEMLREYRIDLIVLARYMQILSNNFLRHYHNRIINIHHSFLPAFCGGRAYHNAHMRGVKLIGATAHYATPVLDDGPIIEQDVVHVTHRDQVPDFIRKGRILERNVLLRALQAYLDDRIIVYNNKCIVFGD